MKIITALNLPSAISDFAYPQPINSIIQQQRQRKYSRFNGAMISLLFQPWQTTVDTDYWPSAPRCNRRKSAEDRMTSMAEQKCQSSVMLSLAVGRISEILLLTYKWMNVLVFCGLLLSVPSETDSLVADKLLSQRFMSVLLSDINHILMTSVTLLQGAPLSLSSSWLQFRTWRCHRSDYHMDFMLQNWLVFAGRCRCDTNICLFWAAERTVRCGKYIHYSFVPSEDNWWEHNGHIPKTKSISMVNWVVRRYFYVAGLIEMFAGT